MPELRAHNPKGKFIVQGVHEVEVTSLTTGQELHNFGYSVKIQELNEKRRELNVQSPCQDNPSGWDPIDLDYEFKGTGRKGRALHVQRDDMERELARVSQAIAFCSYCPVFEWCKPLVEEATSRPDGKSGYAGLKIDAEGVIAGELIDSSLASAYVRSYLMTGKWSGWVKFLDGDEETA